MNVKAVESTRRREWWGFSKEHGWVVLDREIPCNTPGIRSDLMFFRCRDSKIYFLKWELWKLPAYQFAPNHLSSLSGAAADEGRAEFESLQGRWPEMHLELKRQYQEIVDEENAARSEEEKRQKEATSKAKKLRTAAARAVKAEAPEAAEEADEEQG